jgi:hypothetical protein
MEQNAEPKDKVVVILNFYSQSVDFLDYPEDVEAKVINEYDGNIEEYLSLKYNYPTGNICYMITTWKSLHSSFKFSSDRVYIMEK